MGFFLTLFWYAVFFVAAELLRPKPKIENAKPAKLGDFQFPTATEGRVVPLVWGTVQLRGPNVVWYDDLKVNPLIEKVKTGLFSSTKVITGYTYNLGIQFALCRGGTGNAQLLRVHVGDDEVKDATPISHGQTFTVDKPKLFGGNEPGGNGGIVGTLQFFAGTPTQTASGYLSAFQQSPTSNSTPAYRGTAYVAPHVLRTYFGNSTTIKPWKFEVRRIPDGLGLGGAATVNSADANPANVLYEILTDNEWGLGIDPSQIDSSNFSAAGTTLNSEGNGFSHVLDGPISGIELIRLIEEQIDGVVYYSQLDAKWRIKLARADYDVSTIRELTPSNVQEIESFSRGSWAETTNEVRTSFVDRNDFYKETFALAQDSANLRIQGVTVSTTVNFPGVKDRTLANQLAWRELRGLSYPLAKATIIVDRTFFDVFPAEVLAFSDPDLGFDRIPMRVQRIDYGLLEDNKIRLDLVQDIFAFQVGSYSDPTQTGWEPPEDQLVAFPADEQVAFEAPRAFLVRDPDSSGALSVRVWAGARRQGTEVGFQMHERHAVGTPAGTYSQFGEAVQLLLIGELAATLNVGSAVPLSTLLLDADPDSAAEIEAAFVDLSDPTTLGQELTNLILVGSEFMLVTSAQVSGAQVQLNGVYRGALDAVQAQHASGTKVYLLSAGGTMSDSSLPDGDNVDVKLLPFAQQGDVLAIGSATDIEFTLASRYRRPYAPSRLSLAGSAWSASASLEGTGSGPEDFAIDLSVRRRDYRTTDEVASLGADAATLAPDFPAANSTTHQVQVRNDPSGANTLLFTDSFAGASHPVKRIDVLIATDGVLPSTLGFRITAHHDDGGTSFSSRATLAWDFSATSALAGQFNFGALDTNDVSNQYTASQAGTYNFTLSSSFSSGNVEFRLNGGSWTTLIAAGGTSGSIAGVSVSDVIEVRHLSSVASSKKQLSMDAPSVGQDAYAILFT